MEKILPRKQKQRGQSSSSAAGSSSSKTAARSATHTSPNKPAHHEAETIPQFPAFVSTAPTTARTQQLDATLSARSYLLEFPSATTTQQSSYASENLEPQIFPQTMSSSSVVPEVALAAPRAPSTMGASGPGWEPSHTQQYHGSYIPTQASAPFNNLSNAPTFSAQGPNMTAPTFQQRPSSDRIAHTMTQNNRGSSASVEPGVFVDDLNQTLRLNPSAPATSGKTLVPSESVDLNGMAVLGPSDRGLMIFEDTRRHRYLLPRNEGLEVRPFQKGLDQRESDQPASQSELSSITNWRPDLDPAFELEAKSCSEKWNDYRFKVPQTPEDIESVQRALEMTRMDFWIRNPEDWYPDYFSKHKRESYGAQHRRLQHAHCVLWKEIEGGKHAAALFRLPAWTVGFGPRCWDPPMLGVDKVSRSYNGGLAEMVAEANERGRANVDLGKWRAKLHKRVWPFTG